MSKKQHTRDKSLAKAIINGYRPKIVEKMQYALTDIFRPMFEAMLHGEMDIFHRRFISLRNHMSGYDASI